MRTYSQILKEDNPFPLKKKTWAEEVKERSTTITIPFASLVIVNRNGLKDFTSTGDIKCRF